MKCVWLNRFSSVFILLIISSINSYSQPYFDPAGATFWQIPKLAEANAQSERYGTLFLSAPINIRLNQKLVLSPFYESRYLNQGNRKESLNIQSAGLPITLLRFSSDTTWTLNATFIPRVNSTNFSFDDENWQMGGVILNTIRLTSHFKIKFGIYYNREFFSDFFIPLAGVEWKINDRINLFGTLPNAMKFEYRFSNRIYAGVIFKSITNSYREESDYGYYKIEDNHLGIYADFYLPGKFVFMIEAGHTILREFKNRSNTDFNSFSDDSFLFKTGLYYRIRLDQ